MRVLSYGEDPLTLRTLTRGLREFLVAAGDEGQEESATVIYRPSFGRNSAKAPGHTIRSEFGEFDAIVVTPQMIHLVEAKWDGSSELQAGTVTLRPEQQRRHIVLRWYLANWITQAPKTWDQFREVALPGFRTQFPGMTIPGAETKLAKNLAFLLGLLSEKERRVQDVLLFCSVSPGPLPNSVRPSHFRLVALRVPSVGGAGYIEM